MLRNPEMAVGQGQRMAERMFDMTHYRLDSPVYDTMEEFVDAHHKSA